MEKKLGKIGEWVFIVGAIGGVVFLNLAFISLIFSWYSDYIATGQTTHLIKSGLIASLAALIDGFIIAKVNQ